MSNTPAERAYNTRATADSVNESGYRSDEEESVESGGWPFAGQTSTDTVLNNSRDMARQAMNGATKQGGDIGKTVMEKANTAKPNVEKSMAGQQAKTSNTSDLKKGIDDKVAETKSGINNQIKTTQQRLDENVAGEQKKTKEKRLNETAAMASESVAEAKAKVMDKKREVEDKLKDAKNAAEDQKAMMESRLNEAKTTAMNQKAAALDQAEALNDSMRQQGKAIEQGANAARQQLDDARQEAGKMLESVGISTSAISQRMPRRSVLLTGLGVTAAAAGIGYYIYKTYYSNDAAAAAASPADAPAPSEESASLLSTWFGFGASSSSEASPSGGLGSGSSASVAPAADADGAAALLSSVLPNVESLSDAVASVGVPNIMGAVDAVQDMVKSEEVQTAFRGINRELVSQFGGLFELFAAQRAGIMNYFQQE